MNLASLHEAIAAAAPIAGVRVGKPDDRATWSIDFKDEATDQERAAAQAAMDAWTDRAPDARRIHPFYFRLRFTKAQRIAFATSTDPDVIDLREGFTAASTIGLDDPRTAGGLDLLVAKGIIQSGDKAAMLADRREGEKP